MRGFRRSARDIEALRLLSDEWFLRSGWLRLDGPRGPMYVNPKDPAHQTAEFRSVVEAMGYELLVTLGVEKGEE